MALPVIVDGKVFLKGGESDYLQIDLINDPEGLGTSGKTLFIENLGTGGGTDGLYFQLGDVDGKVSQVKSVKKNASYTFGYQDGLEFKFIRVWAEDANASFGMIITGGR